MLISTLKKDLKNITLFRELLKQKEISGYILPNNDEWQNSYTKNSRLKWLTGFSGGSSCLLITQNDLIFFTNSIYEAQARIELDQEHYTIINLDNNSDTVEKSNIYFLKLQGITICYDPMLFTKRKLSYFKTLSLKALKGNLVDLLWVDKPDANSAYMLAQQYAGKSTIDKILTIDLEKNINNLDYYLLTDPSSICWLLNIRGNDVPYSPLLLSYMLLNCKEHKDHVLFVDLKKISNIINYLNSNNIIAIDISGIEKYFYKNFDKVIGVDYNAAPIWFIQNTQSIDTLDPCLSQRACKNETELNGMRTAHIYDGIALGKFFSWIQENGVDELEASDKLLFFRSEEPLFQSTSFNTISAFGANSAIIHYSPSKNSNQKISKSDGLIYLIDSGGQYLCGTTDVTRTIAMGNPTEEQKTIFTAILRGHIMLAKAKFPYGTTGANLDCLARYYLWQLGLDYPHGTGHGVGHFLNVHEGPQAITKNNTVVLREGMVVSIEPGFYKDGSYGMRLENLYIIRKSHQDEFLEFEVLTLVPIDMSLVNTNSLSQEELQWLNQYNSLIEEKIK